MGSANLRLLIRWCKNLAMNRLVLGVLCGMAFGLIDVLMTVFGKHPHVSRTMLLQAFSSRFAIGVLADGYAATASDPGGRGRGPAISLPDAFGLNSYVGVLGPVSVP
jgi:hypothetical protein